MIEDEGPLGITDEQEVVALWNSLRREIRRRGVDPDTADDLAQESWLRTLRAPPERDGRGLGGWLHVVGARLVSEFRRSDRNRLARERHVARHDLALDREDSETRIQRLVAELPQPYRDVVYLRFYEDLGLAEIAERLGRPTVTVRSQLARGLERLRARLGEDERRGSWHALLVLVGLRPGASLGARCALGAGALLALCAGWFCLRPEASVATESAPSAGVVQQGARLDEPSSARRLVAETEPLSLALAPTPAAPTRRLEGTVRAYDGRPVAGATLLGGARRGAGRVLGTSDANGRYALDAVTLDGFVWARAEGHFDARRLHVRSLAPGRAHDFELPADLGPLDVRVREPDGRPAADLELTFFPVGNSDESVVAASGGLEIASLGSVSARTDASGRAQLRQPPEAQLLFLGYRAGALVLRQVVVLAPEARELELTLPQPATVTGLLRTPSGAAAVGVAVVARQRDLELQRTTVTDARGRFEFAGLLPGEFGLQAALAESSSAVAVQGELAEGEVRELLLQAEARMSIRGTASDEGGPLAGARVALYREGRHGLAADEVCVTAGDGSFLFVVDPEVECWLELARAGAAQPCGWARHVRGGDVVELAPAPELERTAGLTLRFRAERPELLPSAVKLRAIHPRLSFDAEVGPDGCARVELPLTMFELAAWVPGVGFWRRSEPILPDGGELEVLMPRPSRIELRLELPPGTTAPVHVGVRLGGLNPFGFEALGAIATELTLTADAERRLFSGELFPTRAGYIAEVGGFTTLMGALELVPGGLSELVLRPLAARRVHLVLELPRALAPGEGVELEARTPAGPVAIPLADTSRTFGQIELVIELPRSAEELTCTTTGALTGALALGPDSPAKLRLVLR